jgi:hypothetical protein
LSGAASHGTSSQSQIIWEIQSHLIWNLTAELGDLYVALSRDLASGTQAVPTFHDAVWQQQLFEQIQDSSETGKRINL